MGQLAWSKVKGSGACLGLCAREQRNWKLLVLNFVMRESRRERDPVLGPRKWRSL